ncbi:iron-sulfur cluster repair protein YtfE [Neptunicella sp.]|uniref:iron-sulfur cluster repair protein YtfE n=1 Tax=Neptunicella sp. TaxID=2125986 RepID=UPI003F694B92
MSLLDQSLGNIATSIAGATAVFHQYKLDFCCGGDHILRDVLAKHHLPEQELLDAFAELQQPIDYTDWRKVSNAELIEHILVRFHQRHRVQLPELIRLARRVEYVHTDEEFCPVGLANHLEDMYQELESHMIKEEQILFPMLIRGTYPSGPISVMEEEHLQHGDALAVIDDLTNNITLPKDACNTWTALYVGLKELKEDLMLHILLENQILFSPPQHGDQYCCGSCQ